MLVLALALVLVQAFVADVYWVESGSMEPTLHGPASGAARGEAVVVLYGDDEPLERFDLVVLESADGSGQLVKRVGALPGETVQVVDGDLWIDGASLPPDAPRPAPIPVFDQRLHDVAESFYLARAPDGPWTPSDGAWVLDARAVAPRSDAGMMLLHKGLRDGWIAPDGERVPGAREVNDGIVELEVRVDELADGEARVRASLVEQGDTFEATLVPLEGGRARVEVTRWNHETLTRAPGPTRDVLGTAEVPFELDRWTRLRFANVDDHVTLDVDGERVVAASYGGNVKRASATGGGGLHAGVRVSLGGERLLARFRSIRILRDLDYVAFGRFAVHQPFEVGPGKIFVLGDRSSDSTDSRTLGPFPLTRLLGRPVAVVWPLGRVRRLEPTVTE